MDVKGAKALADRLPRRGYVTVIFGFEADNAQQEAEIREEIHGDAEDTYQRYDSVDYLEIHDENMLPDREENP